MLELLNQHWEVLAVVVIAALALDAFVLEEDPSDAVWNWVRGRGWRDTDE